MTRFRPHRLVAGLFVVSALALLAPAPVWADAEENGKMVDSLERFSLSWMQKLRKNAIRPDPNAAITFKDYTAPMTELKPTGHKKAPFVGIIRYTERLYTCNDKAKKNCQLSGSMPVTEIFRFQDGRWVY